MSQWLVTSGSVEQCRGPALARGVSLGCVVLDEGLSYERGKRQELPLMQYWLEYYCTRHLRLVVWGFY